MTSLAHFDPETDCHACTVNEQADDSRLCEECREAFPETEQE